MNTLYLIPSEIEWQAITKGAQFETSARLKVRKTEKGIWMLCGVGPAAAALSCGFALSKWNPDRVILLGIGGAFRQSGLALGDVVQAASECFADLGYREGDRYINLDQMNIDHLPTANGALGCLYPLPLLDRNTSNADFVTVSQVTNSDIQAQRLMQSYGGGIENMEGAAVAMACAFYQIPFYQVRAVSNWVGPRDPSSWQTKTALTRLREWLEHRSLV